MVSVYCFVTKACVRRPGAAASVERRRRERRTLLAGAAGELRQARPSSACTFSAWRAHVTSLPYQLQRQSFPQKLSVDETRIKLTLLAAEKAKNPKQFITYRCVHVHVSLPERGNVRAIGVEHNSTVLNGLR
jgi:hypothetical protein